MNETTNIWGKNVAVEEAASMPDPEEKHIYFSEARNQYTYSTLNNSEMIGEQCRLYVGLCRP